MGVKNYVGEAIDFRFVLKDRYYKLEEMVNIQVV